MGLIIYHCYPLINIHIIFYKNRLQFQVSKTGILILIIIVFFSIYFYGFYQSAFSCYCISFNH